jgi:hypothetical protein
MNKDQIVQALMFFAPQAKWKWSVDPTALPEDATYADIVWEDHFYIQPTQAELQQHYDDSVIAYESNMLYKTARQQAYPSVEEQLDMIFHQGIDVWKDRIQNIKNNIPKTGS